MKGISYYGGKQRIASWICEHLPPHTVYVEPFGGGAAVMFKKGLPKITNAHYYREVINDQNDQLITMYRQLQSNPELKERLRDTLYSRSEFEKAKQIWRDVNNGISHPDMDIAWAFFVHIHMSFINKLNGGIGTGVCGSNLSSTWKRKVDIVDDIRERLQYCTIECDDALKVIDRWDSPQTCFYCDPPYPGTDQGHYAGYTMEDYQILIDKLDSIQGSFVLSNYVQGIEPDHWMQIDKETTCSANGKGKTGKNRDKSKKSTDIGNRKRIESIYIMDRSSNARQSLKKHLWCPSK